MPAEPRAEWREGRTGGLVLLLVRLRPRAEGWGPQAKPPLAPGLELRGRAGPQARVRGIELLGCAPRPVLCGGRGGRLASPGVTDAPSMPPPLSLSAPHFLFPLPFAPPPRSAPNSCGSLSSLPRWQRSQPLGVIHRPKGTPSHAWDFSFFPLMPSTFNTDSGSPSRPRKSHRPGGLDLTPRALLPCRNRQHPLHPCRSRFLYPLPRTLDPGCPPFQPQASSGCGAPGTLGWEEGGRCSRNFRERERNGRGGVGKDTEVDIGESGMNPASLLVPGAARSVTRSLYSFSPGLTDL